jgi:Family of unknown function (DUF5683)
MLKKIFVIFFFLIISKNIFGQITAQDSLRIKGIALMANDTLKKLPFSRIDSLPKKPFKINPKLATKRSAILPGWGQIYIKQFWILPIIYGGFAVNGYYIVDWNKKYKAFKNEYFRVSAANDLITEQNKIIAERNNKMNENEPTKPLLTQGEVTIKGNTATYSLANLKAGTSGYRRNRDGSILILPVVWALNILEVNVAAHLKSFDMSDDISMKFEPTFMPNPINGLPTVGGKLILAFR